MEAIIYTSNTGTTKEYAGLLGQQTGLPVISMKESTNIKTGADIIYLGWIMASGVKGYADAAKKWNVKAVCAVGMGGTGTQEKEVRERNKIPADVPVFTLQGGFDINKLHGVYKMMMKVMVKTAGKGLAEKKDRTKDEERMYEMMMHGGDYASIDNLTAVLNWCRECGIA